MCGQQLLVSAAVALCLLVTHLLALPLPDKEVLDNTVNFAHSPKTSSNEEDLTELASHTDSAADPDEPAPIVKDTPDTVPTDDDEEDTETVAASSNFEDPLALKDLFSQAEMDPSLQEQVLEPMESYNYPQAKSYPVQETFADTDLSPRSVAEYLLLSGDVAGFQEAINDLLSAGILTMDDVESYKNAVAMEYETMLNKVMETEADYMQELDEPEERYVQPSSELPAVYQAEERSQRYPLRRMDEYDDVTSDIDMSPMNSPYEQEDSLTQLLETLLNDYYDDSEELPPSEIKGNLDSLIDLVQQTMGDDYALPQGDNNEAEEQQDETDVTETEVSKQSQESEVSEESDVTEQETEVSDPSSSEEKSSPEEELKQLPQEDKESVEEKELLPETRP